MKKRTQGRPRALTDEQVEEIQALHGTWVTGEAIHGKWTQKALSERYNVHPLTIHNVIYEKGPYALKVIPVEHPR